MFAEAEGLTTWLPLIFETIARRSARWRLESAQHQTRLRIKGKGNFTPSLSGCWNVLGYGGFVLRWELTTNEDSMAKEEHNKAAEHHENAAKAHRSAAEHHGKGDHAKGKEHANSAKQHSQTANQHSDQAHSKSQQQK
jgi:hypothetical protein